MLPWDLILSYLQEKTYDSRVLNDLAITHLWNKKKWIPFMGFLKIVITSPYL